MPALALRQRRLFRGPRIRSEIARESPYRAQTAQQIWESSGQLPRQTRRQHPPPRFPIRFPLFQFASGRMNQRLPVSTSDWESNALPPDPHSLLRTYPDQNPSIAEGSPHAFPWCLTSKRSALTKARLLLRRRCDRDEPGSGDCRHSWIHFRAVLRDLLVNATQEPICG